MSEQPPPTDDPRLLALYAAIAGQSYEEDALHRLKRADLLRAAELLLHLFKPTDEQIGRLLVARFGGQLPADHRRMARPARFTRPAAAGEVILAPADAAGGETPAPTAEATARPGKSRRTGSTSANGATPPPTPGEAVQLRAGAIPWQVEIDGVPRTWRLDYEQSELPVSQGGLFQFEGQTYRLGRVYRTHFAANVLANEVYALPRA